MRGGKGGVRHSRADPPRKGSNCPEVTSTSSAFFLGQTLVTASRQRGPRVENHLECPLREAVGVTNLRTLPWSGFPS